MLSETQGKQMTSFSWLEGEMTHTAKILKKT